MGNRISKVYTRTGDDGSTGLGDGSRVAKDDLRVCAYGSVDELNSWIGLLRTCDDWDDDINKAWQEIQHDLFDLGGELSVPGYTIVDASYAERLEQLIDKYNAELEPLKNFILPAGSVAASYCHLARTVCRRAERETVSLGNQAEINNHGLTYLNRLSDLLFVLSRLVLKNAGITEVLWNRPK